MKSAVLAFIVIVIAGYLGTLLAPFFGICLSIAATGACIVYAIEKNNRKF